MSLHISGSVLVNGRGRAGVAISNGEMVVRTDASGRYRLHVDPTRHRFVFVVVPDGTNPVRSFYRPVASFSESGEGFDFELDRADVRARRNFMFAQFTDVHAKLESGVASSTGVLGKDVRKALSEWDAAFVVATGDLTHRGDIPSLKAYRRLMSTAPCPVFNMYAGHDGAEERRALKPIAEGLTRNYESVLGPTYYSFDWGGRHFVLFPNEDNNFAPPEAQAKARWLGNDLKAHAGQPTLLFIHIPPSREFLDTVADTDVFTVFCGHWHASKAYSYRGIRVFATPPFSYGGIDTSPRGHRRVQFRQGRMTTELVPTRSRRSRPTLSVPRRRSRAAKRGPLRLLWSRHLDTKLHRAAPVVANERILLAVGDEEGKDRQCILCLSLETGQEHWRLQTDASVKNAVALSNDHHGDLAVAISVTGRLLTLDIRTGQTVWTTDLPGYPDRWIYTSPAVADGVVYTGAKAGYGAYGLVDGKPLWYHEPAAVRGDHLSCYNGPVVIQDTVVLFVEESGMIGLDRASGRERWCCEMALGHMYPQPLVVDGGLLTGGDPGELTYLDPKNGHLLWRRRVTKERFLSGLGANKTEVFVTAPPGDCRAYSLISRRLKWRFALGRDLLDMTPYRRRDGGSIAGPIPVGEFIVIGGSDGHLYLLDRRTGALEDRWWFGSPISAAPCAGEGRLVVASFDGLLACFEIVG